MSSASSGRRHHSVTGVPASDRTCAKVVPHAPAPSTAALTALPSRRCPQWAALIEPPFWGETPTGFAALAIGRHDHGPEVPAVGPSALLASAVPAAGPAPLALLASAALSALASWSARRSWRSFRRAMAG